MAIKKRNKKSNKKQNNNKFNKNRQKCGQSRDRDGQRLDTDCSQQSDVIIGKSGVHAVNGLAVDVFGDSDKRLDLKTAAEVTSNLPKSLDNSCGTYSPKGLTNLGNTCYLNSILQIISETHLLFELLNQRSADGRTYRAKSLKAFADWTPEKPFDEELEIILGNCLPLTQSLIAFMREMRANSGRTVSPSPLLNQIRKEWTQFNGWSQQDSHELLRCLLDSLKCKEVIRNRKAIMKEFKTTSASDDNNLDDDTKSRIKSFAIYSNLTAIDTVFGGHLLSSVCCDVCGNANMIFEPFFDLSLPLTQFNANFSDNCVVVEKCGKQKTTVGLKDELKCEEKCLLGEDPKNLTPKERKQKRQQKKAAKREEKQLKKSSKQIQINGNDGNEEVIESDVIEHKTNDNSSEVEVRVHSEDSCIPIEVQKTEMSSIDDIINSVVEDWDIEPLFGDLVVNRGEEDCCDGLLAQYNGNEGQNGFEDEEDFGIDLLYNNEELNEWTTGADNDWNEDGWCYGPIGPVFGPQLPSNPGSMNGDVCEELASDESKAQELHFQAVSELETELLLLSISDREKLELKQSTDGSEAQTLDQNSETVKAIKGLSLETISASKGKPNFDLIRLLSHFTSIECLSGSNRYLCESCTKANGAQQKVFTNASKRSLIALPPPVLTLHLKRFEAEGYRRSVNLKKISTFVSFPASFDLSPFVSKMYDYLEPITGHQRTGRPIIYSLYGVVQHSGSLRSGHYTAYVRLRPMNANLKKFAVLEPFVPKMDGVLKMIEKNYFNGQTASAHVLDDSENGFTNGCHESNGETTGADVEDTDSGKWFHISDTSVMSSSLSAVLRAQAYLLFYERIV